MGKGRKQIAFDLDVKALEKYYPTDYWRNAYEDIKRHMKRNGFSWQQGSVYVSNKPMLGRDVLRVLEKLIEKNPWLNLCMRDCRQTNIGREHSQNHLFDKDMDLPAREAARDGEVRG